MLKGFAKAAADEERGDDDDHSSPGVNSFSYLICLEEGKGILKNSKARVLLSLGKQSWS